MCLRGRACSWLAQGSGLHPGAARTEQQVKCHERDALKPTLGRQTPHLLKRPLRSRMGENLSLKRSLLGLMRAL